MVYYSHTQQAQRVSEAMSEVLRARGCDVTQASIGLQAGAAIAPLDGMGV